MFKFDKTLKFVLIYAIIIFSIWTGVIEFVQEDGKESLRQLSSKNIEANTLPTKEYCQSEQIFIQHMGNTYLLIWLFGVISIIIIAMSVVYHLRRREKDLEEIILSSQVFNNTLDAIFITDKNATILRINKAFVDMTGYSEKEAIGKNANILKSTHHNQKFYKNLWDTLLRKDNLQHEIWNRTKFGEIFVAIESISSVKDIDDNIKYFIATMHDITARKNAEERIVHMAHYDPLTNLPNRVLFQDRFLHSLSIARRYNNKVALAFIDIDGFKNINDTKGHQVGDKLLIQIAKIIDEQTRDSDTVSRLGGDEFTIIFENIKRVDTLLPIFEKILSAVRKEIVIDNHSIFISASMGISVFPNDGEDIHLLIQHADTAMYKAKEEGKNCFSFYEEYMTKQAFELVELETSIQSALKNKEFIVYYQPKISAKDKSVIGMEALVRWMLPTKEMVPPDKFIPIAEAMHVVDKIDMFVLEQVCKDMKDWRELGYKDIKVSVNLSGYDVGISTIYQSIVDIVESYGVNAKNIEFEITETYFVKFAQNDMQTLEKLKNYGFTMSIDDFGTGYSSLNNLTKLPVDILKIDQSFIRELENNVENKKLVKMIINLAHTFSLKAIAEGVETEIEYEYLKSQGCDYIQGYLESKPLCKDDFISYLKSKH